LLATVLILASAPACHRFHIWKYPWPQRCFVAPKLKRLPNGIVLIRGDNKSDEDNNWYETLPRR
jgi:hypothetical protein